MSENYDLPKSTKEIGELYPILEAKDGEVIDGLHREQANKNWKRVRLNHIDTEEKKLLARLIANFHRRIVPYEEKKEWINGLAEIYKKQGVIIGTITTKISETTGVPYHTVVAFLESKYKERSYSLGRPKVPASKRIESKLGAEVVERHREEVIAEEKPKIIAETKKELLKSPEFQKEVLKEISNPTIAKTIEPCPSGICELPSKIDAGEPLDIKAEVISQFWKDNPNCLCKTCNHFEKCGVIR